MMPRKATAGQKETILPCTPQRRRRILRESCSFVIPLVSDQFTSDGEHFPVFLLLGDSLHLLPVLLGGALSADREQHFLLTRMYGPAVRCNRFRRAGVQRSCINVSVSDWSCFAPDQYGYHRS